MYPRSFLENYWRNDLSDEVFVAMSFSPKFEHRWTNIFRPTVEAVTVDGRPLRPVRVDIRKSGDSILTEIMDGIAHAQLVLADISVTDHWTDETGSARSCRNGNVMYEVGLALACRQPVDVVLVRDDAERLLFDVSHIPVLRFDPDDIPGSTALIRETLRDRLHERRPAQRSSRAFGD